MITAEQLTEAQARVQQTRANAERVRRERDALIREALAGNWTQRELATLLGVAPSRIAQIASAGPRSPGGSQSVA